MMTPLSIGIPRIDTASGSARLGLLPIMFGGGTDSEVMRRIAAPMIGGMIGAPILSMIVVWSIVRMPLTLSIAPPSSGPKGAPLDVLFPDNTQFVIVTTPRIL